MADHVERFGAVWLNATLGATLFLGVVAIAMVMCGQPARRCTLARAGILGSLAILPIAACKSFLVPSGSFAQVSLAPGPSIWFNEALAEGVRAALPFALGVAGLGTAIALGSLVAGWMAGRRYVRKTIIPDSQTLDLYRALPFSRGERPPLRVSARARSPMLIGYLCPTILIPPDLEEAGQSRTLRLALLHELVHAQRRDNEFGLASAMSQALWFFLPPLWWIRAQMRLDQEFLADLAASSRFGARVDYASSLVGLAQSNTTIEASPESTMGGASLLLRVLMLVRCPYPVEMDTPRWWKLTCSILIIIMTSLSASLSFCIFPETSSRARSVVVDPESRHGVLQMARLLIEPGVRGPDGQVAPYTLLMRLPSRFELVVEVWGAADVLPTMKVCGWPLGPALDSSEKPPLGEGFHQVRIVRDARGCSVWVHGRAVALNQDPPQTTTFLSFVPAEGLPGRFRNLILTW